MSIKIKATDLVPPKFLEIDWLALGRDEKGIDCLGLTWMYLQHHGIDVPDTDGMPIPRNWKKSDAERMLRGVLRYGDLAPLHRLEKFDVILFTLSDQRVRMPDHMAVMVSHSHFLHILENRRSCVQGIDEFWKGRMAGAVRLHKVRSLIQEDVKDIRIKL